MAKLTARELIDLAAKDLEDSSSTRLWRDGTNYRLMASLAISRMERYIVERWGQEALERLYYDEDLSHD